MLKLPNLTPEVVGAVAQLPAGRTEILVAHAQAHTDPGPLAVEERIVYEQAVANVKANPDVVWDRLDS